jgi:cupin 2 domain-containing protein
MKKENLLSGVPLAIDEEVVRELMVSDSVRIEQIISMGQVTPENQWYDQSENEWVLVIKGAGILTFDNGEELKLSPGDYVNIPAHKKHRVSWTQPDVETIWLAIFYS